MSSDSEISVSDAESIEYNPDLGEILKQEIEDEEYVCLICTSEIGISSKVWSCKTCYRVYDVDCIKSWSQRQIKDSLERSGTKEWRCPSCNSISTTSIEYRCWCQKVTDPYYNGLIPHSCGQTCGSQLLNCIHKCSSMCHPGPHVECTAMGPSMTCLCGNQNRQWPCIITPYETGWQCSKTCSEWMPCQEHKCGKKCHDGLCGPCMELGVYKCYCGKTQAKVACSKKQTQLSETVENKWLGEFSCELSCKELLTCGNHYCQKKCHSRQLDDHKCPLAPSESPGTESCYCGKVLVKDILGRERESCLEELPSCTNYCSKIGPCGHECILKCHSGPCPPCLRIVAMKCNCQNQLFDVSCRFKAEGGIPRCTKKCTALKDCRRHRCGKTCCEFERLALERERYRKKRLRGIKMVGDSAPANDDDIIETTHVCEEVCNKLLNCGKHHCIMTCHNGPCHPCMESTLDDWTCPCGQTMVAAPIRCGMKMPKCMFPCSRPNDCGHPLMDHECHSSDSPCPRCTYLVERRCVCGKQTIKGVQCSVKTVSCARACAKKLKCGHQCTKLCHEEGDCQTVCKALCGIVRPCNHMDKRPCHGDTKLSCIEANGPCTEEVTVRCSCGNIREDRVCSGLDSQPVLECDSSCVILERNRRLAEALEIDFESKATLAEKSDYHQYDDLLLDIYNADTSFGDLVERQIVDFVQKGGEKRYRFPVMNSERRQFVHMLATEFNLQSESQDREPKRSVVIMRTDTAKVPANRLRQSLDPFKNYI